jgi:hypothetical protein
MRDFIILVIIFAVLSILLSPFLGTPPTSRDIFEMEVTQTERGY